MIKVGTSGYSFEDWKGRVYPRNVHSGDMLSFYEEELGFDVVEVNYTYYRLPSQKILAGMVRKTSDEFRFVVRSHKEMTHEIWEDASRKRIKDNARVFAQFKEGLVPLVESGKFGCVLIQFPSFFWFKKEHYDYIKKCQERLEGIPLVIEFRNKSWVKKSVFDFLEENGLGFCVVDEPQLPRLMPLVPRSTSEIAYMRFHGRNTNWFNTSREERYNYFYSEKELESFLVPVQSISKSRERTFLFFNNCHAGFAVRNALMMKKMLGTIQEYTPRQQAVLGL